jgi:hypothetical protein
LKSANFTRYRSVAFLAFLEGKHPISSFPVCVILRPFAELLSRDREQTVKKQFAVLKELELQHLGVTVSAGSSTQRQPADSQ